MRAAVNAVLSLDALIGAISLALNEDDANVRTRFEMIEPDYQIARDLAFALKHGELTGRKARLVTKANQISVAEGAFDSDAFDIGDFDTDTVEIQVDPTGPSAATYSAGSLLAKVVLSARRMLP